MSLLATVVNFTASPFTRIGTSRRVPDIVSPTQDEPLPHRVAAVEPRATGRFGHDKPTIGNIVLLIDQQIGLMASTRDSTTAAEFKSNVVCLARVAEALQLPVMISSSNGRPAGTGNRDWRPGRFANARAAGCAFA